MMFRAEVKESRRRIVYVEAENVAEARRRALVPALWVDEERPDGEVKILVYTNSVGRVPWDDVEEER
jgi:hypothetical protein